MTPKEKAKELINKYLPYADGVERQEDEDQIIEHYENAKQCALIAVDEMLNYVSVIERHETADCAFGGSFDGDEYFKFLQQVKTEIKAL